MGRNIHLLALCLFVGLASSCSGDPTDSDAYRTAQGQLDTLNAERASLESDLERVRADLASLSVTVSSLAEHNGDLRDEAIALEAELSALSEATGVLRKDSETRSSRVTGLESAIAGLQEDITSLRRLAKQVEEGSFG